MLLLRGLLIAYLAAALYGSPASRGFWSWMPYSDQEDVEPTTEVAASSTSNQAAAQKKGSWVWMVIDETATEGSTNEIGTTMTNSDASPDGKGSWVWVLVDEEETTAMPTKETTTATTFITQAATQSHTAAAPNAITQPEADVEEQSENEPCDCIQQPSTPYMESTTISQKASESETRQSSCGCSEQTSTPAVVETTTIAVTPEQGSTPCDCPQEPATTTAESTSIATVSEPTQSSCCCQEPATTPAIESTTTTLAPEPIRSPCCCCKQDQLQTNCGGARPTQAAQLEMNDALPPMDEGPPPLDEHPLTSMDYDPPPQSSMGNEPPPPMGNEPMPPPESGPPPDSAGPPPNMGPPPGSGTRAAVPQRRPLKRVRVWNRCGCYRQSSCGCGYRYYRRYYPGYYYGVCPDGFVPFAGTCIYRVTQLMDYESAVSNCRAKGALLFAPRSEEEWRRAMYSSPIYYWTWSGITKNDMDEHPKFQARRGMDAYRVNWLVKPYSALSNGWSVVSTCAAFYNTRQTISSYVFYYPCTAMYYSICQK